MSYPKKEECIVQENNFPTAPFPSIKDKFQFLKLVKILKIEQRTPEWYELRKNMITASNWGACLGINKYETRNKFILKKCGHSTFRGSEATEWGVKYEPVATRLYELRNRTEIVEFGVLPHPDYIFLGASPDGITPLGIMLEIKCPFRREINGTIPSYYWAQMQAQLEVCNLTYCDYLECKIEEYNSSEEYYEDTSIDDKEEKYNVSEELKEKYKKGDIFNKTKRGYEKGVVITYNNKKGNNIYYYSELGVSKKEFEKWQNELDEKVDKDLIKKNITFWRFEKIYCQRVKKNKEWFEKSLPILEETWKEIKERREGKGCDDLLKRCKKKEEKKELSKEELNVLVNTNHVFDDDVDTSDEEDNNLMSSLELPDDVDTSDEEEDNVTMTMEIIETKSDKEEHEFLNSLFDLEIAKTLFPQYMPLTPYHRNERSEEEFRMNIIATHKVLKRAVNALIKILKMNKKIIMSSSYSLLNIVDRLNSWIGGLPVFIKRFEDELDIQLTTELKEDLENINKLSLKWTNKLFTRLEKITT